MASRKYVPETEDFDEGADLFLPIPTVRQVACLPEDEESVRFGDPQSHFDYLCEMYGSGIARPY